MNEQVEQMTRGEMAEEFKVLVHNFVHMNELPYERVVWAMKLVDVTNPLELEWAESYINHWADFLLRLSNETRALGQAELQKNLEIRQSGKLGQGMKGIDDR